MDPAGPSLSSVTSSARSGAEGGLSLEVRALRHAYGSGASSVPVLHGLDLDVPAGGYVALTGPTGAGKTTLLSLLGGLEPLQEGEILAGSKELSRLSRDELAAYRRETVGFVFQHYGLVEILSALENVELALSLAGVSRGSRRERATALLSAVGLAHRADHRPAALSGGERQRVAIARAMANDPELILADEPTGNLDEGAAGRILDLLEELRGRRGCTLVVVTHNPAVAARADARRHLVAGRWDGV